MLFFAVHSKPSLGHLLNLWNFFRPQVEINQIGKIQNDDLVKLSLCLLPQLRRSRTKHGGGDLVTARERKSGSRGVVAATV